MERRLNEVEWSTTSVSSADATNHLFSSNHDLHEEVDDKDRIIRTLESEVEAQVNTISCYFIRRQVNFQATSLKMQHGFCLQHDLC